MLKRLCAQADGYIFLRLYKSYILSILENCNLGIFLSKTNCHRLECVQKKVTKFVCYKLGKNDLKYEDRLKYLSLNSLEDRKFIRGLKFLKKIKNNDQSIPQSWKESIVFENTRNGILCKIPKTRLHKCDEHFFINVSKNVRNSINDKNFIEIVKTFKLCN